MRSELGRFRDGRITLDHHPGQWRAWRSDRRFVLVLAGTQGGKTSWGPYWLWREIQRCGPGDYVIAAPTYPLLSLKLLPEFQRLFGRWLRLGSLKRAPGLKFEFSREGCIRTFGAHDPDRPTNVLFGHAQDPESLESATVKAAWLDECGQRKFRLESYEAILRRLSLSQGRVLMTTTPYDLGWLKQRVFDRWRAGDPDYDVIRFDSTENPAFPPAEMERAKRDLSPWKFDLFYRAIYTRPAGMIYDCFLDELAPTGHLASPFDIPAEWQRFVGLDFGGVNTAAVFLAARPETDELYLYRTYLAGGRTAKEHAAELLAGEPTNLLCVGGSKSEGQWRQEFHAAGLSIAPPPISDVEVGINRVYGAIKQRELFVFDDLSAWRAEVMSYSRELDPSGEPTEDIEDKETYHLLDATRYILARLRRSTEPRKGWRGKRGGYA